MSDEFTTLKATCLCKAAAHSITVPTSSLPLATTWCHCTSCRHVSGNLSVVNVRLPKIYQPASEAMSKLFAYQFSESTTHYYCKTCGSRVLGRFIEDDHPDIARLWRVPCASLEKVDGVVDMVAHMFIDDTKDGGSAVFLMQYEGKPVRRCARGPKETEDRSLSWQAPGLHSLPISPSDRLHGYCKCGGLDFWISRPSERSKGPYSTPFMNQSYRWLQNNDTKFYGGFCPCSSCRLASSSEFAYWAVFGTSAAPVERMRSTRVWRDH